MKLSLNWLKQYLQVDLDPEAISDILTDIGLEVEGVDEIESVKGGLKGLTIGKVLTCEKHPNADKLKLTTVDIGAGEPLHIVCGAPNVDADQKVIVAAHGTTIYPTEGDPIKIKKGKIRGEVSQGMICAEDEIGLGSDHAGIIVLPDTCEVGMDATEHFKVSTDYVYDIGLTPNRSDATSVLGVATDLAAYLKVNGNHKVSVDFPEVSDFYIESTTLPFSVDVLDRKRCPRYTGVSISDVKVTSSPQWMKECLNAIGVRPINNIVDITNFVLHETGQPLHAFDADKIPSRKIIVDTLPEGTKFKTLDEVERSLKATDLMICDGEKNGLCIAGVFGGIGSGVTAETTNIFLEAAHFDASTVRTTSTKHGLRTDAAMVFEKGSDPNITTYALKRAILLIKEYGGGRISSELIDEYPSEIKRKSIELHYQHTYDVIGVEIPKDDIHNILLALNMEIKPIDDESILVKVPTNKSDVLREIDLIEEILRIYGYNKVPIPTQLKSAINHKVHPSTIDIREKLSNFLSANGFHEMMGMSLMEETKIPSSLGLDSKNFIYVNNTSNIHLNIMRPEPLINGLQSVLHNHNYQQKNLKLYEIGRTYQNVNDEFTETAFMTMFLSGAENQEHWTSKDNSEVNFYSIKKYAGWILSHLGIKSYQSEELIGAGWSYGLRLFRGPKELVRFGELDKDILDHLGIKSDVYSACFNLDAIIEFAKKQKTSVKPISKYPAVVRDLALVMDENISFEKVLKAAYKSKSKILQDVAIFDVYKNAEHLGEGKKSYALKFTFQDLNNTLNDKSIEKEMQALFTSFEKDLGAVIRS